MSRILIVDDEELIKKSCRLLLGNGNHQVCCADNGVQALEEVVEFLPDIVITDVFMPEMGGLELIGRIKKLAPQIGVIAISGGGQYGDACGLVMAKSVGADICLEKPLSRKTLTDAVGTLASLTASGSLSDQPAAQERQA